MKTKAICSFFVLFAIVAVMVSTTPAAFADHSEVTIEPLMNSGNEGVCGGETGVECFTPSPATVDVGGKVIFSNTDSKAHTFTAGTPFDGEKIDVETFTSILKAGESAEWVPDTAGEFPYFCMIHPWTSGLIIVQEADDDKDMHDDTMTDETMGDDTMTDETMGDDTMTDETMGDDTMEDNNEENGGCLIATATFGSELAPQVQQLRELRDNQLLQTASGTAFMSGFNQFYYLFSPAVADLEREHPVFKEIVKLTLTPMVSSLSLLNYVDIDSEQEMLGYGISLIILNIGMYVGIPAFGILKLVLKYQVKHFRS